MLPRSPSVPPYAHGWTLLFLLASTTACDRVESSAHAGPAAEAPRVTVAEVATAHVDEWTEHTGRADAVESIELRARTSGYLTRVAFRDGELVDKGDLLFVVDPRPYQAALANASAELERAKVDRAFADRDAKRANYTHKTGVITDQEWDSANSTLGQLDARVHAASAAVTAASLDVEFTTVRAPIAGRMGRVLVNAGNLVSPSTASPLATLVSTDPLYVYVDLDEARAMALAKEKHDGKVMAEVGFPDEAGHPHRCLLDFLDNRVDPATGTLKVRVVVPNPDNRLTPGLFARVRLPVGREHDAVLIQDRALGTDQDRRYVMVVGADDKTQYRKVTLGPVHDGLRVVRDGLAPHERIVVDGLQRIRPGIVVTYDTADMKLDGGAP